MSADIFLSAIGRCKILQDSCNGLMAKLAYLNERVLSASGQHRPLCLKNPEYQKIRKKLETSFPEQPDVVKTALFEQSARSVLLELTGIYNVFEDVLETRDAVLDALRDLSGAQTGTAVRFQLDTNALLMASVMNLLVGYVRLHMVVNHVEERKGALAMFYAAHSLVHKRQDVSAGYVSSLIDHCEDPIRRLTDDFAGKEWEGLHTCVAQALREVTMSTSLAMQPAVLREKKVFNLLDDSDAMALPAQQPLTPQQPSVLIQSEMMHAHDYAQWVVYCGLVLPGAVLTDQGLLELFRAVCSDCLVVPIFRDMVLNVHTETERLAGWFPPKNVVVPLPKDTKLKKFMKDLSKDATQTCGLAHKERRAFLRGELSNMKALLQHVPGLLGPKFPVVLSAMAMARSELAWYCQHVGQSPVKNRVKHYEAQHFLDPLISTLIGVLDEVLVLVNKYSSVVQRYYQEYLQGAHRSALSELVTNRLDVTSKLSKPELDLLNSILQHLDAKPSEEAQGGGQAGGQGHLRELRWDCSKLVGSLSLPTSTATRNTDVVEILRRVNTVYTHSKYQDRLPALLQKKAELSEGWWFFQPVLLPDFEQCLQAPDSSSKYATAYIKVLSSAINNVHEHNPEEQLAIGSESATWGERLAVAIAERVEQLLHVLCQRVQLLEHEATPTEAANRFERQHQAMQQLRKQQGANAQVPGLEPLPGAESHGWDNAKTRSLAEVEPILTNLLLSLNVPNIVVFDRLIVPKEYVREQVASFFRSYMYQSVLKLEGTVVEQPSVVLDHILGCCSVLQNVMARVDLDVTGIIRKVLLDECTDWSRIYAQKKPDDKKPNLLDRIAAAYLDLLNKISPGGSVPGVVYVPAREGFVSSPHTPKNVIPADMYMDKAELRALCTLLGSGGARAVEKALLEFVSRGVMHLKGFLAQNEKALSALRSSYSRSGWEEALRAIAGMDQMVVTSIAIGNALTLRQLLREALAEVYQQSTPFLHDTMRMACMTADGANLANAPPGGDDLEGFKSLAEDFGLFMALDHSLAVAIAGSSQDMRLWELLPYAFAACFTADIWKRCEYVSRLDGFVNNEHMIIPAILELFGVCFAKHHIGVTGAYKEFVRAASFVLLRMSLQKKGAYKEYQFRAMFTMLDKFVEQCPSVDRSVLEMHIPYALLHTGYLEMSRSDTSS